MKILWLAPMLNHYKIDVLNQLAQQKEFDVTVVSGSGRSNKGDSFVNKVNKFEEIRLPVFKEYFGCSLRVLKIIMENRNRYHWIMIPAEKKNFPLLFLSRLIIGKKKNAKLMSYNHAFLRAKHFSLSLNHLLTTIFFGKLDRVIFYTKEAMNYAVSHHLLDSSKAFYANNTLVSLREKDISMMNTFSIPEEPKILFLGRLIRSKNIDIFFDYYRELKNRIPILSAAIIGDGPERDLVIEAQEKVKDIQWYGAIADEKEIASIILSSSMVFVPGHSGLSINHAFAYGRPYVTFRNIVHGPEIDYIQDDENGLLLEGGFEENVNRIMNLFESGKQLESFSRASLRTAQQITIEAWLRQIKLALLHERY